MAQKKRVVKVYRDSSPEYGHYNSPPHSRQSHSRRRVRRNRVFLVGGLLFAVLASLLLFQFCAKPYTVALDPGHGGTDVGADGIVQEVKLTEATIGYLKELLRQDGRFRVVVSRKDGEKMGINDRREKLKRANPDLSLCIHANSDESGSGRGFEVYPTPPGRDNHEKSLTFAQALVRRMQDAGSPIRGDNGVKYAYYSNDKNGNEVKTIKESTDSSVSDLPSFGMVEQFSCAAVLTEQCFVTNQQDVDTFGSDAGCQKAAQAYYLAICDYLGIEAKA